MDQINSEILRQFEKQGLTFNEGITVDAWLVVGVVVGKMREMPGIVKTVFLDPLGSA